MRTMSRGVVNRVMGITHRPGMFIETQTPRGSCERPCVLGALNTPQPFVPMLLQLEGSAAVAQESGGEGDGSKWQGWSIR